MIQNLIENWPAPAKINLFLHIIGRREDGYHLLQTAFQFLDYADQLRFSVRKGSKIRRITDVAGVPEEQDLCVKAAILLQQTAGIRLGIDIEIEKQIPMGGGLGGGSSNAATTLCALNFLWGVGYSADKLAEMGLTLGADVPVFVRGLAAWAEGVGEQLQPFEPVEPWYLLIAPPVHVSTAEIFNDPNLTRLCSPITIRDLAAGEASNVCESVVCERFPEVAEALNWLSQRTDARMTGTGACVFGRFDTETTAQQALLEFQQQMPSNWRAFVAKGLNRSPLLERVSSAV